MSKDNIRHRKKLEVKNIKKTTKYLGAAVVLILLCAVVGAGNLLGWFYEKDLTVEAVSVLEMDGTGIEETIDIESINLSGGGMVNWTHTLEYVGDNGGILVTFSDNLTEGFDITYLIDGSNISGSCYIEKGTVYDFVVSMEADPLLKAGTYSGMYWRIE